MNEAHVLRRCVGHRKHREAIAIRSQGEVQIGPEVWRHGEYGSAFKLLFENRNLLSNHNLPLTFSISENV
jgi:hypothetical protein